MQLVEDFKCILMCTSLTILTCENPSEAETPYLDLDQTFNVSLTSGWKWNPKKSWPVATVWLSTDSIYSSSMVIYSTVSYSGQNVIVRLDSIRQPTGSLPAFMRARGGAQILTSQGTHRLTFQNGNVSNVFSLISMDSSVQIEPLEVSYMEMADEGDFWHPTDP